MKNYPLKDICKDVWQKKVSSTSMYTIPAQDQALPVLIQFEQILTRLLTLPIQQTLDESLIPYFFTGVFPTVCQKIIRSRYFKSSEVLKLSNLILQKSIYLLPTHFDIVIKNPRCLEILTNVFSDEHYFKTNNQMSYMNYPYSYFPSNCKQRIPNVKVDDLVDVLKIGSLYEKVTWSVGRVLEVSNSQVQVAYLYDKLKKKVVLKRDSQQLAPYKTKSHTFQWRLNLKEGDLLDFEDSYGTWYNGTVLQIIEQNQGVKLVRVTLKVYNEQGNKEDEKGKFFGFDEYEQILDFTSPKIAPFGSIAKIFCYESSKIAMQDSVQDINDYEFQQLNGQTIYALPRRKNLSQLYFLSINQFGKRGGFQKFVSYLEKQSNFQMLAYFIKGISGVCNYLNRKIVNDLVQRLKKIIEKHLFESFQKTTKNFTKQISEMTFSGFKILQKRLYANDIVYKYENKLKMRLVQSCLQSEAIKNKLQGLNQLKDIMRSVIYTANKYKYIRQWVKQSKLFEKIYIINSHVQLIKKSQQFFKYLINQNILEVTDLKRLYLLAQKSDFQSRISLYKLFQEVSHVFKKEHVEFLIDTILQSELNFVLHQDIDLLFSLSKFFNYFPVEKVMKFFESLILEDYKNKELNDYAIKRYAEMVAKNSQFKQYRRGVVKLFLSKLQTHDINKISRVIKYILEGVGGFTEWSKKDIAELVAQQRIDQVLIQFLEKSKTSSQFSRIATFTLDLLHYIYKLSTRTKINTKLIFKVYNILKDDEQKFKQFFRWVNQLTKCQQGFQTSEPQQLQQVCKKLFSPETFQNLQSYQFQLFKNIFVQINKKSRYISITNAYKDRQMQKFYCRKVQIKTLKLINLLLQMIYRTKSQQIGNQILSFFINLYISKQNSQAQIDQFLTNLLTQFQQQYQNKNIHELSRTIKLMQVVINDSQKCTESNIKSLISKTQPDYVKFIILNQVNFISSETSKKLDINLPMNMQVIKLRKILAKQFKLKWDEVKIVAHNEIDDYYNSQTLKQIKLNPNQPLTVSRRSIQSKPEEQLIFNDQFNPKAVRCFQIIFDKYSANGKMDKSQCNSFTLVCLGSNCSAKYYHQKISSLYQKYDDDQDGYLTCQNFLQFYLDAAKDRPSTVWSNLHNFGVRGDFKFNDEPQQSMQITRFPRNTIAQYPKIYQMLFELLHSKDIASVAFELLQRLPVSNQIQQSLLSIQSKKDLQLNLETKDIYQLYYKLNIIEYLTRSSELETQNEKNWHIKFIKMEGYEVLFKYLQQISQQYQNIKSQQTQKQKQSIFMQINQTILKLLNQYWIKCFSQDSTKIITSLAIINCQYQIDDKMDYFMFGRFFRNDRKIQPKVSKLNTDIQFLWMGPAKQEIIKFLVHELQLVWLQTSQDAKVNKKSDIVYSLSLFANKLIDSINILLMNQDPKPLLSITQTIFDNVVDSELIKNFYCLIMSQCYYSTTSKYQGKFIKQLFKNLTKQTITSQHFRVLAALVSRFGIQSNESQDIQQQQTTQKLKKVLFENVLNNNNELTVEGCAKLLTNFYLSDVTFETFQKIWNEKLFNPQSICQKQQTRVVLFNLILKICDNNQEIINNVIAYILSTLQNSANKMKIVYCNQFKQRSQTGFVGLKNLGNTCYINSMIQQLFTNKNFRYSILRADDQAQQNIVQVVDNRNQVRQVDDNFLHQLQRIFAYLQLSTRIDFMPRDFCVAYKPFGQSVNIMMQQDVQQFVSMFFDRLEAGLSKTAFRKLVDDYYTGKATNLIKCHSCQKTKKVEQSFYSISLQVKTSKTLAESINRYCHGQMISDYKCDFCQAKVDVTKKTRINRAPKILIIHLQRIVFSLDTFVNQKITTKHSFPNQFNLHQASLDYYQKTEAGQADIEPPKQYNYNLIGIICHSGNAQSGHYISYIKTGDKWIQFNDSQVLPFNPSNIQSQCFGGYFSSATYDDDFYEEKKQNSKSAYLLLYEKEGAQTIQIILDEHIKSCKTQKQRSSFKNKMLETLQLKQIVKKLQNKQQQQGQNKTQQEGDKASQSQNANRTTQIVTQSHQQSSETPDDSQNQTKKLLEQKQLEIKRHQSEDNIQTQLTTEKQPLKKPDQNQKPLVVFIQTPISSYVSQTLKNEVEKDNQIHFIQKCLSSSSFVKFFSQLISRPHGLHAKILPICQKFTFGFWLKSSQFKDLLRMLDTVLKQHPQGFENVVTNNTQIINLLIQSSDAQIRSSMASFLSKVISDAIQTKKLTLENDSSDPIFKFLDKLLSLLPSTVSKCWTKFSQYFQFWYELSNKGDVLVQYMISREIIKHFMDYFLDTKSPLKIYATKREHSIGSSYATPNFGMLLKCVFSLLQQRINFNQKNKLIRQPLLVNSDEETLLMSYESLQKLITDNFENIAAQLVKQICPNNLAASEKVAIVLLKGICKSSIQTVQPYLEILHQFVLIQDQYQDLRIKWVIGKQTLALSTISMKIIALNSYSLDERLHNYDSSIQVESGSSLLQSILTYCRRIQTFAMLCTKQLLKLCTISPKIRKYVFSLQPPTLQTAKFVDFFPQFIKKYCQDYKKSSSFYTSGFNRQQFGKQVSLIHQNLLKQISLQQQQQKQSKQNNQKQQVQQPKQKQAQNATIPQNKQQKQQQQPKQQQKQQNQNPTQNKNQNKKQNNQIQMMQLKSFNVKKSKSKQKKSNETADQDRIDEDVYDEDDDWQKMVENNYDYGDFNKKNSTQAVLNSPKDDNQQYQIKVCQSKKYSTTLAYSQEQQSQKQNNKVQEAKDYQQAWHPVKFQFKPTRQAQYQNKLLNLLIEEHQSEVTYVLTKPTGHGNNSFQLKGGVQKNSQKMLKQVWQNQKITKLRGFYARNNRRQSVRIQTEDGCVVLKPSQNVFIFADQIIKVWQSQRSIDWPKWRLYENKTK